LRDAVAIGEAELRRLSDRIRATPGAGLLLHTLDWAHMALGHLDVDYATRALDVWVELGDLSRQANILNHLGMRAFYRGEWDRAVDYYERAREASDRAGHEWKSAVWVRNIAEVRLEQGRLEEAEEQLRWALHVLRAVGSGDIGRACQLQLVAAVARQRRLEDASGLLDQVVTSAQADRDVAALLEAQLRRAEISLIAGDGRSALPVLDRALAEATSGEQAQLMSWVHRLRALALAQCERWDEARACVEQAVALAIEQRATHDEAFGLHVRAMIAAVTGEPVDVVVTGERDVLFARLGIVEAPSFPLPVALPEQAVAVPTPA
jgi:tetratricopeptide (TPR) repeat protein